jgi:hypothetical protein
MPAIKDHLRTEGERPGVLAARVMLRAMPPKTMACRDSNACQQGWPARPREWNKARFRQTVCPARSRTDNSGQARQFHLGAQPQQVARLDRLYPPEVERVAWPQMVRIAPASDRTGCGH